MINIVDPLFMQKFLVRLEDFSNKDQLVCWIKTQISQNVDFTILSPRHSYHKSEIQ